MIMRNIFDKVYEKYWSKRELDFVYVLIKIISISERLTLVSWLKDIEQLKRLFIDTQGFKRWKGKSYWY